VPESVLVQQYTLMNINLIGHVISKECGGILS